ncbi:MAG: hypothetical protein ACXABO_15880 [Promethearchaeota archaeon]|jgi:hypothetical protein
MSAIPSLTLWVLAWIFLIIGLGAMIILVVYTRYGREKSVRLSVVSIIIASTFLGFSVHFFLLNFGI